MYLRHRDIAWDSNESLEPPVSATLTPPAPLRAPRRPHPRSWEQLPMIELGGVHLHAITERQCIEHILMELDQGRGGVVITPNLDHLRRCMHDLSFEALVGEADLIVADGMPLVWASWLQGTPLPERVAGSNLVTSLSAAAAERERSIFLLGGAERTAEGAAEVLRKRFPGVKIAGTDFPRYGFERNPRVMAEIAHKLASAKPDIVYVALGSPKQEQIIAKLRQALPGAWWLGVGVSFSFLCGHVRRAPMWMQRWGFEWVHRLWQEPVRLFKRYLLVGIPFAAALLARATMDGIPRRMGLRGRAGPTLPSSQNNQNQPDLTEVADQPMARVESQLIESHFDREPHNGNIPHNGEGLPATDAATDESPLSATIITDRNINNRLAQRSARRMASQFDENGAARLSRLRALVLLGGSVRPTVLSTSIGRSLLDLPLDENGSVLNHWLSQAAELAKMAGLEKLPLRLMVDRSSPEPISAAKKYYGALRVERDLSDYRGSGGVLGDLASDYDDDDLILVANAAQILLNPLCAVAGSLNEKKGDVTVISHRDGSPSGVMLVNCKTLRLIPKTGFVDMKEQALPTIASRYAVEVVFRRRPTGLPIRAAADYVQAMRYFDMRRLGKTTLIDPLAEDWQPSFGIVEEGASVDRSVRVHDSVVLRGGVVESGAVLVRSVVGPGGAVRRGATLIDDFACATPRQRRSVS